MYCGCLPCLLVGHLDRHTTIEHVTEAGRRVGDGSDQHENTIGMCLWTHFGVCDPGLQKQVMIGEYGPSLAHGRRPFEAYFGDELNILLPIQNFLLEQFAANPWNEYHLPGNVARLTREKWINLNASAQPQLPARNESS